MISVIIITENGNYSDLDVPADGRLIILERHLICAVVQNGVKMVMYGETSPLLPFEVYIQGETLSLDMVHKRMFHPEGRILDFTTIELLQLQQTIHPSNSGSTSEFEAPSYTSGGYPINYNLRLKGANFVNVEQAQAWLRGDYGGTTPSKRNKDCIVNSLANDGNYQLLSCLFVDPILEWGLWNRPEFPITEVYDDGLFTEAGSYVLESATVEIFRLSALSTLSNLTWYNGGSAGKIKLLEFPALLTIGADTLANGTFNKLPLGSEIRAPRALETANAGAMEGDLLEYKTNRQGIITFID